MSLRLARLAALAALLAPACGGGAEAPAGEDLGLSIPPVEPTLVFEDVTAAAGLAFVHENGAFGEKRLPETMGAGVGLLDQDGDGALDVFLVNGRAWDDGPRAGSRTPCALYRGRGDGTFTDVSREAGADVEPYGMGCAAADYDGDGDEDLYVTALGDDLLLENDGGRLRDVAARAGVGRGRWRDRAGREEPEWTTAALWFDADQDGDLDLLVGGYCQWTPELEVFTTLNGVDKAFTTPDHYSGLPVRLYTNDGTGTFTDVPDFAGPERPLGKALGAALLDLDEDGRLDVVVANDTRPNFLLHSLGGGRFEEVGAARGIAYDENGRARAGMGIDTGVLPRWGTVVSIGNFAGEPLSLYRRDEGGRFLPTAAQAGLARPTDGPLAFGLALADLDLDGWLDLVVANGHIEPDIARFEPGAHHAQPAQLFLGLANGFFEDVSGRVGADFAAPRVGRGLACGDLDGDGDLDLLLTQNGGRAVLLANRVQERAPRHFLRVELAQAGPNRRGLGARVRVEAGGRERTALVRTGSSYLSQGETTLTFGLGAVDAVERVRVRFPDGSEREVAAPAVDRTLRIEARP